MRKTWFLLCVVVLITAPIIQFNAAGAQSAEPVAQNTSTWQATRLGLPNFDIRQEIADIQLPNSSAQDDAVRRRLNAIDAFLSRLPEEMRGDLRYEINERRACPRSSSTSAGRCRGHQPDLPTV
jgi:hypothetical protein